MYDLRNLREMLCKELDEIADKREMSACDLDAIQKLTSSIKNTYKIEMLEDGGYSSNGEWEADMRGSFSRDAGNGYNRSNSYANRGRHYVRGHYSRTDGRERMISDIEDMMQDATGAERDAYKRAADILRNA